MMEFLHGDMLLYCFSPGTVTIGCSANSVVHGENESVAPKLVTVARETITV